MTGLKYQSLFKSPLDHINSLFLAELKTECCLPAQAFSHLYCCQVNDLTAYTCVNSRVGAGKGSSFAYVQSHMQLHLDIRACAVLSISVWRKFLHKGSFKTSYSQAALSISFAVFYIGHITSVADLTMHVHCLPYPVMDSCRWITCWVTHLPLALMVALQKTFWSIKLNFRKLPCYKAASCLASLHCSLIPMQIPEVSLEEVVHQPGLNHCLEFSSSFFIYVSAMIFHNAGFANCLFYNTCFTTHWRGGLPVP